MPFLLALLGAIVTAYIWANRAKRGAEVAQTRARMDVALRKHLQLDAENAQEIAVLGRWLVEESGGPTQGFERLARKLRKLDAGDSFDRLMAVLSDIADAADGPPSARQSDALADLARIFRVS